MKKCLQSFRQGLYVFFLASLLLVFTGCSSDDPQTNTDEFDSSNGLKVVVKNNSGRVAYIKFTGKPLTIDKNDVSITNGKSDEFSLTSATSGRIYISYDKALSSDEPDGANSSDKDYKTRFDKIELTYTQGGKANLTAVDFYSIPMILETSIQGTTIEHLTLGGNQTGKTIEAAITGILSDTSSAVIKGGTSGTETVRILSPVKSPGAYSGFDVYLNTLINSTLKISGTFYGTPSQNYNYSGSIAFDFITLSDGTHTIKIPMTSLMYSKTDLSNHNGIYTCNGAYTVNGVTHHVGDNDIYAAVYRDLITAFNLGFVKPGVNDSKNWWQSTPFQGISYNNYAKVIADMYPGAYGFPFTDRYNHILADLGGKVDTLTITLLDDNTSPAPYTPQGTKNPQTGTVKFNMVIITPDSSFNNTTFTFDLQSYKGGNIYTFPTSNSGQTSDGKTAVINDIPAVAGLNIYDFILRGKKYTVLMQVDGGKVSWGSISGGGDATWTSPNLFIGGLN